MPPISSRPPTTLTLIPDEYHLPHVGRTEEGRQFFLTTPFVPAWEGDPGREFLALYLFDPEGHLVEARIEDLGTRAKLDRGAARALLARWLHELGHYRIERIRVCPFQLERFGTVFGLVPRPPEDKKDHWWVIAEPGDYLAFYPPWDGLYDT